MRDKVNGFSKTASIAIAAKTATATGTAVDLANADGCVVEFNVGTITDGTHTPKLTECDTSGGTYTDVAAADQVGTLAALATNTLQKVGYIGTKRYIKAVVTVAGATTGGIYGADVLTFNKRKQP